MSRSSILLLLSLILMLFVSFGCSGSGSPISPSTGSDSIADFSNGQSGTAKANRTLWGMWHVSIDPRTYDIDIVPIRGAMFTCNVTQFMQPPISPTHMISLTLDSVASDFPNGLYVMDVTLRHPFPGMNYYNGFDVRGIFMADGSIVGEHDSTVLMSGDDDSVLENADGYTRFWNWTEFTSYESIFGATHGKLAPPNQPTATINPYKYFADDLEIGDPVSASDPAQRGFFTSGSANSRRYEIQFKMDTGNPVFDFNYAVDASWSDPDESYTPDYPIEAFALTANCAEAYNLSVMDAGSDAWYVDSENYGGEFILDIEIFDHQGAVNPSGIPGEISAIWLEGETLTDPVDILGSAVILPGNGYDSSVFQVNLASPDLTHHGTTDFLCTVESADPATYEPQVDGGEFFDYPDAHLSAYFKFSAEIDDEEPFQPTTPPIIPVCIDPDVAGYGVQFAIASDGLIHSVYQDYDRHNAYWSYSDDLGNTWNQGNNGDPIYSVEPGHTPPYLFFGDGIAMDAEGQYVYVLLSEYDGEDGTTQYCKLSAGRLDITDLDAGWETFTV